MSKKSITLIIIALAALAAWWYFLIRKAAPKRAAFGVDDIPDQDGYFYFQYHGGSALREDSNGSPINCGTFDMPAGTPAPTNFYSFMEIGKLSTNGTWTPLSTANCIAAGCRILPGDTIENVEILIGENNTNVPLQGNNFQVLQLGTDTCTPDGQVKWPNNGILIDLVTRSQGATESNFQTTGQVFGRFKLIPAS